MNPGDRLDVMLADVQGTFYRPAIVLKAPHRCMGEDRLDVRLTDGTDRELTNISVKSTRPPCEETSP